MLTFKPNGENDSSISLDMNFLLIERVVNYLTSMLGLGKLSTLVGALILNFFYLVGIVPLVMIYTVIEAL